ncbi:MAG: 3-methyl-2-oxobutanoate dehydrogenase subunit VorB [Deltaproteobacteria bacterium]|nr:MAG: 3-methyl-2-oxobutanoate dehydrogenase subunit VorB [Deltaproteobacteria bacterium]
MNKMLMSGNHAAGEAAIRAGCKCYFGYPITPQNELTEYMAANMPNVKGGVFIQAESEIAAVNMVLGAALTGVRAMTSSSSPGISLKQEGISYLAGCELPAVIINVVRGGPGLGNIAPSQSDYFQATRGGGHGDYRTIVLAPSSVQELVDLTMDAFELADEYRNPVLVLGDGLLGQMMEPVEFKSKTHKKPPPRDWVLDGAKGRKSRFNRSLILDPDLMEEHNWKLARKYQLIERKEIRYETYKLKDAKLAIVAFGVAARVARGAIKRVRENGLKVGLIRPITLWPFPYQFIRNSANNIEDFIAFEFNTGQMVEDVRLALEAKAEVYLYARPGGVIPTPIELSRVITRRYYEKFGGTKAA